MTTTTTIVFNVTVQDNDGFPKDYDQEGAMHYIVSTVLVYSLIGVLSMLCARIKRQQRDTLHRDEELGRYLKLERKVNLEAHRQKLMQHRKSMVKAILNRHEERRLQRISETEEVKLTESDLASTESDTSLRSAPYSEGMVTEIDSPEPKTTPYTFPIVPPRKKSTATLKSVKFTTPRESLC